MQKLQMKALKEFLNKPPNKILKGFLVNDLEANPSITPGVLLEEFLKEFLCKMSDGISGSNP